MVLEHQKKIWRRTVKCFIPFSLRSLIMSPASLCSFEKEVPFFTAKPLATAKMGTCTTACNAPVKQGKHDGEQNQFHESDLEVSGSQSGVTSTQM